LAELDVCVLVEDEPGATDLALDLMQGLSTLRFGFVRVAPRDLPRDDRRPTPENVDRLVEIFPAEDDDPSPTLRARLAAAIRRVAARAERERALRRLEPLVAALPLAGPAMAAAPAEPWTPAIAEALEVAAGRSAERLSIPEALSSREALDLVARVTAPPGAAAPPYLEAFVRYRAAMRPLFRVLRPELPLAAVYHAVGTGLAGIAAAAAAARAGAPLVVSERAHRPADEAPERRLARRLALARAAVIAAPSEALRARALAAGAPEARTLVLPDGIDDVPFSGLRAAGPPTEAKDALLVALVAPIVPDEDVKTFVRASKILVEQLDLVEIAVIGSREDDDRYLRDCALLAQTLGVERLIRFSGPVARTDLFQHLDCLVLTSARGGEGRVLLEAMAAGVPCVATDAGPAREMLEGRTREDRALGPAGVVVPVADHEAVAAAVRRVVTDAALRRRLAEAGTARVARYYRRERAREGYRALYERARAEGPRP
jgi:glycosyltransferase involved in cell wall biosynthesis